MGLLDELKRLTKPPYEEEDDIPFPSQQESTKTQKSSESNKDKVLNLHTTTQLQVVLVQPDHFEDAPTIADHLRERRTVVLNLEKANKDAVRRIVDFLSGVVYAQGGKIKTVAKNTYIITPFNVDIMGGDLMDEIESIGWYM